MAKSWIAWQRVLGELEDEDCGQLLSATPPPQAETVMGAPKTRRQPRNVGNPLAITALD